MPRRLWGEDKDWYEEGGPDPLDCEGDLVAPFGGVVDKAFQNPRSDELTDDEAPWMYQLNISLTWTGNRSRRIPHGTYMLVYEVR